MYYRLSCVTHAGEIVGYQWRTVDLDTFTAVAAGQRPLGDSDAQLRDQTGTTVYYGHVWSDSGWQNQLAAAQAADLYQTTGRSEAGA